MHKTFVMNIRIWDNVNKQWLEPMAIYFKDNNTIERVTAIKPDDDPLTDGWYDIKNDDLKHIAIIGDINFNVNLIEN